MEVDELMGGEERQTAEVVRDQDGFVRPAVPRRQTTQERRNSVQRASQLVLSPPRSALRSQPYSPGHSPQRAARQTSHSLSPSSPSPIDAAVASPITPPRAAAGSSDSMQRSLGSQLQSQVESQAWDLTYHYPDLDVATRQQLIVDRGLTSVYGQGSSADVARREESRAGCRRARRAGGTRRESRACCS